MAGLGQLAIVCLPWNQTFLILKLFSIVSIYGHIYLDIYKQMLPFGSQVLSQGFSYLFIEDVS